MLLGDTKPGNAGTAHTGLLEKSYIATGFKFDVAIVGLGYVGLPTSLAFHAAGCRVLGIDVSEERLDVVRRQRADLVDADRERLAHALEDDGYETTSDTARLAEAAAVIVCVPTPVDEHLTPELGILRRACRSVVEHAVPGQALILTSTTYVGSTRDLLATELNARGLTVGTDVFVAFSPERIDPGNDRFTHEEVPRVVGGVTPACTDAATAVLRRYTKNVHGVDSTDAAEMTKLVENTFRAVNIALANEFAEICRSLRLDVMGVINAAATKPYGFMPFFPGPGVGGHCIPCDPHYLLWQLRKKRLSTPLIEQAMSGIAARPHQVAERARQTLSEHGRGIVGARVLVVGISYKPNVEDLRESPALEIIAELVEMGADVRYHDPNFPVLTLSDGTVLTDVADPGAFEADLVIVHTVHDEVDLGWLETARAVLDTTYRLDRVPSRVPL
ncbi:nucleotide sugar dehydrogenase [Prescottella agglutinans]|uniref:Nucleotide sugar dehydrogenase n=1 Tax=Prescottella agglutinans TaxID=1644129 RepID=A0A438B849_9NOCA|nr:nucleotide sugar dehydrogenase [Prescottella agglutinans]RVW07121.1 nucleotide sugar dehydrogenase [Prescottella agglutinans]